MQPLPDPSRFSWDDEPETDEEDIPDVTEWLIPDDEPVDLPELS